MNERCRAGLVLALGLSACGEPETRECPSAVAMAESTYLECTAQLGLDVESLEIDESGDIAVVFGDAFTPELAEFARRECEPLMEEALTLGLVACEATDVGHPASAAELQEQVDRAGAHGFSGSVVIVRDGMLVWKGGTGLANRERGIENTTETAFDCGSIMKVMTAAAIFQLEEDGVLARDMQLGELFADVPADKAAITLDQVLAHAAGFAEVHDTEGDFEEMDRATALARIFAQELLFAPGTAESYSSSGYTLLAAVVEDASGLAFPAYLRARIFDAAGMHRSGVYGDGLWPAGDAAIGYDDGTFGCNSPGCWPAPTWALMGNGGLVSTVDDLVRWTVAVEDAVLFDATTRDAFRRDVLGSRGVRIDGERAYAYSGRNDFGFGAAVGEVPTRGTYVVVAANAAASYNDTALMAQLVQSALGAYIELTPP